MSIKQDEAIRQIPLNNFNMSKAMRKAGYTEQGSRAGNNYARLRKRLEKLYDPETIKADISKYRQILADKEEWSNLVALLTLQAKITGLSKDNAINQTNIIQDKDIQNIADRVHIDASASST